MKEIIKQLIPPLLLDARIKIIKAKRSNKYTNKLFLEWWNNFRLNSNLDDDVVEMVDIFTKSEAFPGMSKYWNYLNMKNLEQLSELGFENFKQTISENYYTWIKGISGTLGANLIKDVNNLNRHIAINQLTKKHDFFDIEQSILFNAMTVLLYNYIENTHPELIEFCEESTIGNAPAINIDGKLVSQDVLNSAIEYASIVEGRKLHPDSILEIGAGSGRTSEFFLKKKQGKQYIICDIVPALFISQKYLSTVFPDRKIFMFREFNNFDDVADEFSECEIGFIMPHQLSCLPDKYFDTCLAIDCLHEMKSEQISVYFTQADRLANYFYFKAWNNTTVPFDEITLTKDKYITPQHWKKLFLNDCYIPSDYFEAMYQCQQ